MAKRTDMGKKFVKRSGKGFDQIKDLKISNDALLILKKNNNSKEQIEKLKKKINILRLGGSVSGICLDYYLSAKTRLNFELGGMATHFEEFFRTRTILFDISKRYFGTAAEKMDYLIFYGYNLSLMGDSKIKADKMVKFFKEKIHEKFKTLKKEQAIKKIKELYKYEEVSFLGLTYGSFDFKNRDFLYAIGDGNYLFGSVYDINPFFRFFRVMFVLFDEYNWGNNDTYFFKMSSDVNKPFTVVVETAAFKKFEKEGLAKPFLTFFVDREVYFY